MGYRDRVFDAFEAAPQNTVHAGAAGGLFSNEDNFDFFRAVPPARQYLPKTQASLRKAFAAGLVGIEHFLQMATSLRPLSDEAQDVDEITKLFSQQKLARRPDAASVRILRGMIKDPDSEIALYAAEGLNTIENTFIERIARVKKRLEKSGPRKYIHNFLLGKLYLEFAGIMEGQELIRLFYLREAEQYIGDAHRERPGNYRIGFARGRIFMGLARYDEAIGIFGDLSRRRPDDARPIFLMAECCYHMRDYDRVIELCRALSGMRVEMTEEMETIVYQWIL